MSHPGCCCHQTDTSGNSWKTNTHAHTHITTHKRLISVTVTLTASTQSTQLLASNNIQQQQVEQLKLIHLTLYSVKSRTLIMSHTRTQNSKVSTEVVIIFTQSAKINNVHFQAWFRFNFGEFWSLIVFPWQQHTWTKNMDNKMKMKKKKNPCILNCQNNHNNITRINWHAMSKNKENLRFYNISPLLTDIFWHFPHFFPSVFTVLIIKDPENRKPNIYFDSFKQRIVERERWLSFSFTSLLSNFFLSSLFWTTWCWMLKARNTAAPESVNWPCEESIKKPLKIIIAVWSLLIISLISWINQTLFCQINLKYKEEKALVVEDILSNTQSLSEAEMMTHKVKCVQTKREQRNASTLTGNRFH